MSKTGLLLILIKNIIKSIRSLGFILIYVLYKIYINPDESESEWLNYIPYVILALLFATLISGYFYYKNYTFYIDADQQAFIVEQGVFNKEQTIIQLDRILQVNIKQDVWHQVLDIYELEIETAGTAQAEVKIIALSEEVANKLKESLNSIASNPIVGEEYSVDENVYDRMVSLGNKNIILAAFLSHYGEGLRVAVGFVVLLFSQFRELTSMFSNQSDADFILDSWDRFNINELIVFAVIFLLVPFVVNAYRFVIKYYNTRFIIKENTEMLVNYGLFTLQEKIFKVQKLQMLHISNNAILRKLNLNFLTLAPADVVYEGAKNNGAILLPGLKNENAKELEELLFGEEIKLGFELKPLKRKFIFQSFFALLFAVSIYLLLMYLDIDAVANIVICTSVCLYNLAVIIMKYKHESLYIHPNFIVKKYGSFRKKWTIMQPHKIQNVKVTQKIWKPNFGNLYLYTASGTLTAAWYDILKLKSLVEGIQELNIQDPKDWM